MANIIEVGTGFAMRRLSLGAEDFSRTFNFGQRWSRIKIGVLWGFNGESTFSSTVLVGVGSGVTNTFNSASCDGFYGLAPVTYPVAPAWTYAGGPPKGYTNATTNAIVVTKIATTVDATAALSPSGVWAVADAATNLSMWIIDITRNTGWNRLVSTHAISTTVAIGVNLDSDFKFYRNLEHDATTAYPYGMAGTAQESTAVAWTGGDLDSFSMVWGTASPTVDIAHIGVMRFY